MSIAAAALVALALPAAAQATTYTVTPGPDGPCAGTTCPTLQAAADAVGNNDTVNIAPGQYASATFNASGLDIAGTGPGVVINGSVNFGVSGGGVLRSVVVDQTGAVAAILAAGPGLELRDVIAVSASDGVLITAGTNKIVRSTIATTNGDGASSAVQINSTGAGAKSLRLESTFVSGGNGGVRATATGLLGVGDITITAFHLTAADSDHGLFLEALPIGTGGNVSATFTDSITLKNVRVPGAISTATLTPAGANITDAPEPTAIFADPQNRNFRLKPGSPAIGAGGVTAGESPTDVDGQDRSTAPTDLGADEYVNTAPKAAFEVVTKLPKSGQPVAFDGSGSTDQPGGGVAAYKWEFGDGAATTTAGPTVSHTYTGEGPVTAKLTVVDGEGAPSTPATKALTIFDGTIPSVTISKPKSKQKINQFVTKTKTVTKNGKKKKVKVKTKTRTRIKFAGTATDKSGVARVILTVEKTANAKKTTVVQGSATSTKKCRWLDPKKGLKKTSCAKPILIIVKLKDDGSWAYNVRKSIKLSTGTYRAIAYGLDKTASFGNSAPKAKRNITFTIK